MRIKGTFLDEISHDIPHQNWGEAEWDRDFGYMREAGIDTVILIRCGYRRWQTFPSRVLTAEEGCYEPPVDLVDMFLRLSDKWGMNFWFGLYDSGKYWDRGEYEQEVALNKRVIDEVWSLTDITNPLRAGIFRRNAAAIPARSSICMRVWDAIARRFPAVCRP